MDFDNRNTDYEEAMILPGLIETSKFVDEPMILPGILDEFDNIETTPESIDIIKPEAIVSDEIHYSSNCLALTVVPDYKMLSIKNIAIRSAQVTYKILFSTIVLNIIKLFC